MKKIFLIVFALITVVVLVTVILQNRQGSGDTPVYQPIEFPVGSSTVSVNYETITQNPNAIEVSEGMYNLNEAMSNPDLGYALLYSEVDDSIYLSIDKEPLLQTRKEASQYLLDLLEVTPEVACTLKVYVGVLYEVNPALSGINLGLSFCPGSVEL